MNSQKTKHIQGIGPIQFVRSSKAKRVNISIRPDRGIRVAVPRGISFQRAEQLIESKHDWIKSHQEKLKAAEKFHNTLQQQAPTSTMNVREAKLLISNRLNLLSERYGFSYNRLFIRNQKTRWGSCSSVNNINLNIKIAKLPPELMDYVILHELVHTRIKNHSKSFWNELDYYVGNAKAVDKELKKFKLEYL